MGNMITLNIPKFDTITYEDIGNKEIIINSDNILVMEDSGIDSRLITRIKFTDNETGILEVLEILVVESKEEVQSIINS